MGNNILPYNQRGTAMFNMAMSVFSKFAPVATFPKPNSCPKQLNICFQKTTIRYLSSNPDDNSKKVHELKNKPAGDPPSWHKFIPTKSLKKKLENKNKPSVAVLNLHGQIAANTGGGGLRGKQSLNIGSTRKLIDSSFALPKLEAVLLSINSPGGSPAQSELIADYIQLLANERKVKVYSFVQDVAASGGYWLACAGEKIYITENSVVGSIGVISASFGFQDAIKYLNIEPRIHTAGKNKAKNNPFLPESEEDLKRKRVILDKLHTNFKIYVTRNRNEQIKEQDLDHLFSGEYWVGREAIELGLADDIGTVDTFIRKEFGGPTKVNVKEVVSPKSKLQKLFGASDDDFSLPFNANLDQFLLRYMMQRQNLSNFQDIPSDKYQYK